MHRTDPAFPRQPKQETRGLSVELWMAGMAMNGILSKNKNIDPEMLSALVKQNVDAVLRVMGVDG